MTKEFWLAVERLRSEFPGDVEFLHLPSEQRCRVVGRGLDGADEALTVRGTDGLLRDAKPDELRRVQ